MNENEEFDIMPETSGQQDNGMVRKVLTIERRFYHNVDMLPGRELRKDIRQLFNWFQRLLIKKVGCLDPLFEA